VKNSELNFVVSKKIKPFAKIDSTESYQAIKVYKKN